MDITIFTLCYNESARLSFMLDHYKKRFPNSTIILHDNNSTDNTVDIANQYNCNIINYNVNEVNDDLLTNLKNNCWKSANTDWVLVCDPDELLDITEEDLYEEDVQGTTVINGIGYNIINMEDYDELNLDKLKYGLRAQAYDKSYLFNKKHISEINYNHGCHKSNPIGKVKYNIKLYNLYHYHCIGINFVYNRYQMTAKRMSEINKKNGWGSYCFESLDEIKQKFYNLRKDAIKLL